MKVTPEMLAELDVARAAIDRVRGMYFNFSAIKEGEPIPSFTMKKKTRVFWCDIPAILKLLDEAIEKLEMQAQAQKKGK